MKSIWNVITSISAQNEIKISFQLLAHYEDYCICICLINSFVRGIYILLLYYHLSRVLLPYIAICMSDQNQPKHFYYSLAWFAGEVTVGGGRTVDRSQAGPKGFFALRKPVSFPRRVTHTHTHTHTLVSGSKRELFDFSRFANFFWIISSGRFSSPYELSYSALLFWSVTVLCDYWLNCHAKH